MSHYAAGLQAHAIRTGASTSWRSHMLKRAGVAAELTRMVRKTREVENASTGGIAPPPKSRGLVPEFGLTSFVGRGRTNHILLRDSSPWDGCSSPLITEC